MKSRFYGRLGEKMDKSIAFALMNQRQGQKHQSNRNEGHAEDQGGAWHSADTPEQRRIHWDLLESNILRLKEDGSMSKSEKSYGVLDEETIERLLVAFGQVRRDRGFTEAEFQKVLDWANLAVVSFGLLIHIKEGKIGPDLNEDGEVIFCPITPPTLH